MAYKYCCKRRGQSRVPGSPSRCRGPWADVMRRQWLQGTLSLDCVWPLNSRTCGTCSVTTTRICSVDGAQMQGYGASNGQCNYPGLVESRGCGKMPSPFGGDWWHGRRRAKNGAQPDGADAPPSKRVEIVPFRGAVWQCFGAIAGG